MANALRAFALLACSAAALYVFRTSAVSDDSPATAFWLAGAAIFVPFVMAVLVAWRGHDRG